MRCRVALLWGVLLATATVLGAVPTVAQPAADSTVLEAQLQADGDARWSIVATVRLEDESDVENFRSFADAFERGERDFPLGVAAFRRAAAAASNATGREMSIHSTNRSAVVRNETEDGEVVDRYGELRVSFVWTGFARIGENGTMYVSGAFNTTNGTWLPSLGPDQALVIRSPPGYSAPTTSPIGAVEGDLRWEGPRTFEPGYFYVVYEPAPSGPVDEFDASTVLLAGALVFSLAALLLGLYLLWRRRDGVAAERGAEGGEPTATDGSDAMEAVDPSAARADVGEDETAAPDPTLLSDEERVEYMLDRNGGRMKQATIVKETGWSNAKVSQILSAMAEDDRVDKLRIGRENLISLPDEDVTDVDDTGAEGD